MLGRASVLRPPPQVSGADVEELLRRYDPRLRKRWGKFELAGGASVRWRRGLLTVRGSDRLARGLRCHLGGKWLVAPPEASGQDESMEDMLRVYVPRKLLPAELALALRPVLPGVVIREDRRLGLFWFDDEDSDLVVSAWGVRPDSVPPVAASLGEVLYECGVDDVEPTPESLDQAWHVAEALQALGGVPVDRYGFRVSKRNHLSVVAADGEGYVGVGES